MSRTTVKPGLPNEAPETMPVWVRQRVASTARFIDEGVVRQVGARLPGGFRKLDLIRERLKLNVLAGQVPHPLWLAELKLLHPLDQTLSHLAHGGGDLLDSALPALRTMCGSSWVDLFLWLHPSRDVCRHRILTDEESLPEGVEVTDFWCWHEPERSVDYRRWVEQQWLRPWNLPGAGDPAPAAMGIGGIEPAGLMEGGGGASPPAPPGREANLIRQEELEKLEEVWSRRLREVRQRNDAERVALEGRLQESERQRREEVARLEAAQLDAEAECVRLRKEFDVRLEERLRAELDVRVRPWLQVVGGQEQWLDRTQMDHEAWLTRVDEVLDRQVIRDKACGTRSAIRQRLEELRRRQERAREMMGDSLQPDPSLPELIREIERRMTQCERQLDGATGLMTDGADSVLGREMAERMAVAASVDELDRLEPLLIALQGTGFLPEQECRRLMRALEERRILLRDPLRAVGMSLAGWDGVPDPAGKEEGEIPAGRVLDRGGHGIFLVDIYNLIGRRGRELGLPSGSPPTPAAWEAFQIPFKQYAVARPNVEFLLMVDSPHGRAGQLAPNVRIDYSGGRPGQANRADHALLGHLQVLRRIHQGGGQVPVFVVTDDMDLRKEAQGLGARVMDTSEFVRRLVHGGYRRPTGSGISG